MKPENPVQSNYANPAIKAVGKLAGKTKKKMEKKLLEKMTGRKSPGGRSVRFTKTWGGNVASSDVTNPPLRPSRVVSARRKRK